MSFIKEDYINVDDALKRVGGNIGLYHKLLGRFVEGNQLDELEKAFEDGDTEGASRMAHTIKGVAANLSLVKLQSVSAELEHIVKDSLDHAGKLSELRDVYSVTVQVISELTTAYRTSEEALNETRST